MKIVCFGDSLTSCGGEDGRFSDILQVRFPAHVFVNRGAGGESFVEGRERIDADVLAERPDVVLLEFGANDWWRDERPYTDWAADLEDFVRRIVGAGAKVAVLGVFGPHRDAGGRMVEKTAATDERAEAYRKLEQQIARTYKCAYVANIQEHIIGNRCCWRDRNHPNEYGNRYVADTIEPVLEALLGSRALPVRKGPLLTLNDLWREALTLASGTLAVSDGEMNLTYGEADAIVRRLAAGLRGAAGRARPKVAVFLPNCLEFYMVYWAVMRLGGVIVPLNVWLRERALAAIIRNVEPDLLIVNGPKDAAPIAAARDSSVKAVFAADQGGAGAREYDELLVSAEAAEVEIAPEDPAIVMHTSGTTGRPKGAIMRHQDLLFNVMTTINAHQFSPSDVHLLINPMFHCTPLYSMLPAAAYQKAALAITAESAPAKLMETVERERVTTFLSTPYVFQHIANLPTLSKYDYSSLRLMAYAGAPMPVGLIRKLQEKFPDIELHNFFGMTETISMTHVLRGEDALEHPDSIGRLLPFVEAKIVDENGGEVPPGTEGELLFARENVIQGYYHDEERMRDALRVMDGREWFATGDLALTDEEGFFYVRGRKKDMIIVGGENVFAAEVEAVILENDKVRDAAVKGVPAAGARASLGELVKAYVVPEDPSLTERDVKKHCTERLASYKVPHDVVFLEELPRSPTGKVIKDDLP